jgi:hypothetical protein
MDGVIPPLVEDEVAQAVRHKLRPILQSGRGVHFEGLDDVRMGSEDDVGSGIE